MRASTANRAALWVVAAVGLAALIAIVSGDPGGRELAIGAVYVALVLGGGAWLAYRYRVLPRRTSFVDQVERAGLMAEPGDPLGLLDSGFGLFGRVATVRDVENTARGVRGGLETVVADYWFSTSSDATGGTERFTCVLTPTPSWWPDLAVVSVGLRSRLVSALGLPEIETELEDFNRRFEIRSSDPRFANALLDARFMAWLLEQPPWIGFEIHAGRLLVFRPRMVASLDDVEGALALRDELVANIPRVVQDEPI
jgi:hypothetical protein